MAKDLGEGLATPAGRRSALISLAFLRKLRAHRPKADQSVSVPRANILCRLLGHRAPIRRVIAVDREGRDEEHTCPRCGHVEQVEYDIAGERLYGRER